MFMCWKKGGLGRSSKKALTGLGTPLVGGEAMSGMGRP